MMRAVKIVFFMQDTGAIYGAERATLDLAAGLRAAGEEPVFFLMSEQRLEGRRSGLSEAIEAQGFAMERFPVAGRFSWGLVRSLRRRFAAVGGEVLHVLGYKANLHALLAGIRPRVTTVHGWLFRADWKERLYGWIEMFCLRRCDRVIALSRYYENYLAARGVKHERLERIPSGLPELPASFPAVGAGDGVCFGMMGRFSEEKNHAMFLRAAARVVKDYPAARFKVAGNGPLEGEVRAMAGELGLGNAVEFCGYQGVDDYFAAIDVYVICSKIENLPYSILEAMARSRPVIGTSVGGIPDLIQDGDTGYLVAAHDDGALAEAMAKYLVDSGQVEKLGAGGKRKLVNDFGFERCIAAHRVLYRGLSIR